MVPTLSQLERPDQQWYALFVRTKYERVIEERLKDKGFETYVPTQPVHRKWADRIKVVDSPLFPNYVFCRFDPAASFPVVTTPDVRCVVGTGRNPTPIPAEEIYGLRQLVLHGKAVEAVDQMIEPGQRVVVVSGPLEGVEGTVIRTKGSLRLVVYITLLHRGVAAETDRHSVRPVRRKELPGNNQRNNVSLVNGGTNPYSSQSDREPAA